MESTLVLKRPSPDSGLRSFSSVLRFLATLVVRYMDKPSSHTPCFALI